MQSRKILVVTGAVLLAMAGAAFAAGEAKGEPRVERHVIKHRGPPMGHSVEHTAMHNIMAELLSAKSGKTAAEIQAMFDSSGPETFEQLGVDEKDVPALFKQARGKLIDRAQSANLITAAQADKLRSAKVEMKVRFDRGHPPLPPPPPDFDEELE